MRIVSGRVLPYLIATLVLAINLPVEGATVKRFQLDEIRDNSVSVFWGQVVDRTTRVGPEGKMVWTDYEVSVSEHLKGSDPGVRTIVSFAGGTSGEHSVGIAGVPRLTVGENYVFFIQEGTRRPTATIGWGQGLFHIERTNVGGVSRDLLISYDGEPLQLAPDGRLERGPMVRVENGSVFDASLRLDPTSVRMQEPVFTAADGSALPRTPRAEPEKTPLLERRFATLDDLRSFIDGRLQARSGGAR